MVIKEILFLCIPKKNIQCLMKHLVKEQQHNKVNYNHINADKVKFLLQTNFIIMFIRDNQLNNSEINPF